MLLTYILNKPIWVPIANNPNLGSWANALGSWGNPCGTVYGINNKNEYIKIILSNKNKV